MLNWFVDRYQTLARALTWAGVLALVILTVVPATDRPVTGGGRSFEHVTAFALVAAMFALGYRLSPVRRLSFSLLFCGAIELLQVPLPTRHARVSDFAIDLLASWFAIAAVLGGEKLIAAHRRNITNVNKAR